MDKVKCPTCKEISDAGATLDAQWVSIYQELCELGYDKSYYIERHKTSIHWVIVRHIDYPYSFMAQTPVEVVANVKTIERAIQCGKTKKISPLACCPLAEQRFCVCTISFTCLIHGNLCYGSHD